MNMHVDSIRNRAEEEELREESFDGEGYEEEQCQWKLCSVCKHQLVSNLKTDRTRDVSVLWLSCTGEIDSFRSAVSFAKNGNNLRVAVERGDKNCGFQISF